jgi:hypothetical protein
MTLSTKAVLTSVFAICWLTLTASGQALAAKNASEISGDNQSRNHADNTGRKLASASPRVKPGEVSVDQVIQGARTRLVSELNARDIKVSVPPIKLSKDIEATCDNALKGSRTAMAFAREHAVEMTYWLGRYFKQMISPPVVTPVALHEYHLVPSNYGQNNAQLYLTDEGRLKHVVDR